MIVVALAPALIWPSQRRTAARTPGAPDSAQVQASQAPAPTPAPLPEPGGFERSSAAPVDTVWVTSPLYRLGFSTLGGQLVWAELTNYRSFAAGDSTSRVQLIPTGRPFLVQQLLVDSQAYALKELRFKPSAMRVTVGDGPALLTLIAEGAGARVTLHYRFVPDDYRFDVRGEVTGLPPTGARLGLVMGDGLRSVEADTADDYRNYAVVTKAAKTESHTFGSLDPGEMRSMNGPFEWVALKSKYFLFAA